MHSRVCASSLDPYWAYLTFRFQILIFLFFCCFPLAVILVPSLGIEPGPTAVKVPHPNQWTTRKFTLIITLNMLSGARSSLILLKFDHDFFLITPTYYR